MHFKKMKENWQELRVPVHTIQNRLVEMALYPDAQNFKGDPSTFWGLQKFRGQVSTCACFPLCHGAAWKTRRH